MATDVKRAPAGWYQDPGGRHAQRFWDGDRWTEGVADGSVVAEDALPAPERARSPLGVRPPETRAELPARAAGLALAGLVIGVALGAGGSLTGSLLFHHSLTARLVGGQLGLWGGWLGACWVASSRYATGHVLVDFGGRLAGGADVLRGLALSIVARFAAGAVLIPLLLVNRRFIGDNSDVIRMGIGNRTALITIAAIAVVGAPFVEELFFRGLLQRSLESRLGGAGAVVVQAVVFGVGHGRPDYGVRNVAVILSLTVVGLILGATAQRYRRLGPGMLAHGMFNLVAVAILLATL
jgi:membrane protease YdiL (CAAX protease family)